MTSRVDYPSDGATRTYSVPFPYILKTHVVVYIDGTPLATPADYVWSGDSAIELNTAAQDGAVVTIQRETPSDARLVNFVNGANLTEDDLNLSANQEFYLLQEQVDQLQRMLSGQYTLPLTTLLESAADSVLTQAAALEVQTRVTDIDTAGEQLLDKIMQLRLLGRHTDAYDAFILDTQNTYVSDTESFADRLTSITAQFASSAASVSAEAVARASADSALASSISTVSTTVAGHTASITSLTTSVNGVLAEYGVSLNVNGFITGFVQNNNGTSGTFDILTSKFRVVDPGPGAGATPVSVFSIESGNVLLRNLYLDHLIVGANGAISVGKSSSSNTTSGFWLGTDGAGGYDFLIGDANGFFGWDGSAAKVTVCGDFALHANSYNGPSSIGGSWGGFGTDPTHQFTNSWFGDILDYSWGSGTGVSNATTFTVDPVSSGNSRKVPGGSVSLPFLAIDNGNTVLAYASASGTTWTLYKWNGTSFSSTGWTNSGAKGFLPNTVVRWKATRPTPSTGSYA
jgi:hypothetical protein